MLERLRRAQEVLSEAERAAADFLNDRYVQANLLSLRTDVADLMDQWEAEARVKQRDVVRYRLIPSEATEYAIRSVTSSLHGFQEMFSQVFDALKNGAKRRARLTADVLEQTCFNFAFSYPGSLGVAMSIDASNPGLFEGKFDAAVEAFMQIVAVQSEDELRNLAKKLGNAVVKRTFEWSRANLAAEYSVDLRWVTATGQQHGGVIDVAAFRRIVTVIERTSETETSSLDVAGLLTGFDGQVRRFRFVGDDDVVYLGTLSESFPAGAVWRVNAPYEAKVEKDETLSFATQETRTTYRLKHLEPLTLELPLSS
jgi:hypothetical protein